MALSLINPEIEQLAQRIAAMTGENLDEAVRTALVQRLEREQNRQCDLESLFARLEQISHHCASAPDLDTRGPDQIVGYDDKGLW